jgi:citrate lyase subunit gamma (acyl carrier protein)
LKKPPAKEEKSMEIKKAATAGTLESSDCMVTVEPGEGKIDFSLESSVIHQYGNQLRKVALETLKNLDIDNIRITIVDKGALDCTLKARIEGAVFRSVDQYENLPWGGAIR